MFNNCFNKIQTLFKKKDPPAPERCPKCDAGCYGYYLFKLIPDVVTRDWGKIVPDRFITAPDSSAYRVVDGTKYIFPAEEHYLKICLNCLHVPNMPYWFIQLLNQSRYCGGVHGKIFDKYQDYYWEATREELIHGWDISGLSHASSIKDKMYNKIKETK